MRSRHAIAGAWIALTVIAGVPHAHAQSPSGAPVIDAPQSTHRAADTLEHTPALVGAQDAASSASAESAGSAAQNTAPPPAVAAPPRASSVASVSGVATPEPPSDLYGALYRDVELAHLFPDSKTFADMIPDQPPARIVRLYHAQRAVRGFDLRRFVDAHFTLPPRPPAHASVVANASVSDHIRTLWQVLKRDPDRNTSPWSSLLALPNPYIVPGDRFDEIYYWDSYFIMLGLEQDDQHALARAELDNFAALIDRYGHIPNGNRSYYLSRSQPPFFAAMVALIADRDGDQAYVRYLPELEREYAYWMQGADTLKPGHATRHVVRLADGTVLNRYWDARDVPRDESYREDVLTARSMPQRASADLWRNLRAGGESGWDFSSRWFADGKTLATIEVTSLIPIDLNTLMFNLERTLAIAHHARGDAKLARQYQERADARADAIRRVLWDPDLHAFGDDDFVARSLTHRLSAATVYPLYFGVATRDEARDIAQTIERKLLQPGGIATTTVQSGQQWDMPNGWAPLEYLAVIGLRRYGYDDLAKTIAMRWIATNLDFYARTGKLVEKYDIESGKAASGGEYALQEGFGWTNGVLATLLALYPDAAKIAQPAARTASPNATSLPIGASSTSTH
ncbi:alpha,alpha-trehalase TreA [Pararobbsia silviterrae]|uniref:Alpha,alpha-trehalase TreA n=2 Tax=Pararobbsia silviterrae TaxID=1792498 RepID=A0A494XQR0_9BURK|nr:alpha,alpha-trehalase TreA [Pararobbsia silviterrae]